MPLPAFLTRWFGRPAPTPSPGFDAHAVHARLAETLLRTTAEVLGGRGDSEHSIARLCESLLSAAPQIRLCWSWFGPPDADTIVPQRAFGPAREYAGSLKIDRNAMTERGPAFRALRGERGVPFDVSGRSAYSPWRDAARVHGIRSVLALPLRSSHDAQRGLLVLYASQDGFFDRVGLPLFESLAALISALLSQSILRAQLAEQAITDPLTGLVNRREIDRLHRAACLSGAPGATDRGPGAVLLLDLDHFKRINDDHGHAFGDEVLRRVAALLQAGTRRGDHVARWGGEEFLVWLTDVPVQAARVVADKLRQDIAAQTLIGPDGQRLRLTASIGVSEIRAGESLDHALARADASLYVAKAAGRDRVVVATPDEEKA